jgi:two-component system NtrC family sensor kinase
MSLRGSTPPLRLPEASGIQLMTPPEDEPGKPPSPVGPALAVQREATEELLQVVLGLTGSIILEFDAVGRYRAVWTRSEELLTAPREQLLGRTLTEVFGPEMAAPFLTRIQSVLATGRAEHFEYSLDVASGRRWFGADAVLMPPGQSVLILVRDITQQKELEQRMLQQERLASLGTLAAGVAHEVNNPLSYVSANLNFAVEGLAEVHRALQATGAVPEPAWLERTVGECVEALLDAQEGTGRIRQVVGDLRTFARGEDKSESQADVRRALEAAIGIATSELRHRARVITRLDSVPLVRGSEARLGQVFLNLLINAAQAIPEGAPEKNRVEVRLREEAGQVVIEIEDTGVGVPPELRERIFDPFFSTKPVGVGTGLGLSICHGIVTGMGGDISVESSGSQGSCFRVRLPIS